MIYEDWRSYDRKQPRRTIGVPFDDSYCHTACKEHSVFAHLHDHISAFRYPESRSVPAVDIAACAISSGGLARDVAASTGRVRGCDLDVSCHSIGRSS